MAKNYQINEILSNGQVQVLHPETNSNIVKHNSTTVKDELESHDSRLGTVESDITTIEGEMLSTQALAQKAVEYAEGKNKAVGCLTRSASSDDFNPDSIPPVDYRFLNTYLESKENVVHINAELWNSIVNKPNKNSFEDALLGSAPNGQFAMPTTLRLMGAADGSGGDSDRYDISINQLRSGDVLYIGNEGYPDRWIYIIGDFNESSQEWENISEIMLLMVDTSIDLSNYYTVSGTETAIRTALSQHAGIDKVGTVTSVSVTGVSGEVSVANGTVSTSGTITVGLASTGIAAGTYSAIQVDVKGRAIQGGQIVKIGGSTAPNDLAIGGIWFKEV